MGQSEKNMTQKIPFSPMSYKKIAGAGSFCPHRQFCFLSMMGQRVIGKVCSSLHDGDGGADVRCRSHSNTLCGHSRNKRCSLCGCGSSRTRCSLRSRTGIRPRSRMSCRSSIQCSRCHCRCCLNCLNCCLQKQWPNIAAQFP